MIVVLLANGFEEIEALTPVDIMRRNNIDVRTVSVHSDKLVTGTHGIQVTADLLAADVPVDDISMLVLPGGMPGVSNLDVSPVTHHFIDATVQNGGRLAAICAAPIIFGKRGMLTNVKATCFPGFEGELASAQIVDARVITDGIFTTAKDYTCAAEFSHELIRLLSDDGPDKNDDNTTADEAGEKSDEQVAKDGNNDRQGYIAPNTDLLKYTAKSEEDAEQTAEIKKQIMDALESLSVSASISKITHGPRLTRYEITPARGVRVQSVIDALNTLTLIIHQQGVRIQAPIPGKSAIGLEIPRKRAEAVSLREMLESEEYRTSDCKLPVCIGKDVTGTPVISDITKFPHVLVAGATGMGKSVCIHSMLISAIYKSSPDELKLLLIDPKHVEYTAYNHIPHLLTPIITDADKASVALMWAYDEMERRYDALAKAGARNIEAYNEKVADCPELGEKMPKIVIAIDELYDLMVQAKNPTENMIMRMAQKSRAAGIYMILGTQRPDARILTETIKVNIGTRIALRVSSVIDSRNVLDTRGAEALLNNGDMLYSSISQTSLTRVQGSFISDEEIFAVTGFVKEKNGTADYDERVNAQMELVSERLAAIKDSEATK